MARILIAEDEPDVRAFVRRGLALDGHDIEAVADGGAALEAIRRAGGGFDWDASTLTAKGNDNAKQYLFSQFRKGWEEFTS